MSLRAGGPVFGLALLLAGVCRAETPAQAVARDLPGWTIHQQAQGPLAGGKDFAAVLTKPDPVSEKLQALLVVYSADGPGRWRLRVKAPKAICVGCGGAKAPMDEPLGRLAIDQRGVLSVTYEGGSREEFSDELKWRLDRRSGRFVLIGETYSSVDTVGQDPEDAVDVNFTTLKMERRLGKRRRACLVPAAFQRSELSAFDFFDKHFDDLDKLKRACPLPDGRS
jgi:hypothetical protein